MSWFHVDDRAHSNAKIIAADERAIGAWTKLGSWSAQEMTDGVIPGAVARKLCTTKGLALAVEAHILHRDESADTFTISGFLDCNPSAAKVRARRAGDLSRQDRHRGKDPTTAVTPQPVTRDKRRDSRVTPQPVTRDPSRARPASPAPAPDPPLGPPGGGQPAPTEPVLTPAEPKRPRRARKGPEIPLPEGWGPKPNHYRTGDEHGLDRAAVDHQAERFKAHAASKDRRLVNWDAGFTNWLLGADGEPSRPGGGRPHRERATEPAPGGEARLLARMEALGCAGPGELYPEARS